MWLSKPRTFIWGFFSMSWMLMLISWTEIQANRTKWCWWWEFSNEKLFFCLELSFNPCLHNWPTFVNYSWVCDINRPIPPCLVRGRELSCLRNCAVLKACVHLAINLLPCSLSFLPCALRDIVLLALPWIKKTMKYPIVPLVLSFIGEQIPH